MRVLPLAIGISYFVESWILSLNAVLAFICFLLPIGIRKQQNIFKQVCLKLADRSRLVCSLSFYGVVRFSHVMTITSRPIEMLFLKNKIFCILKRSGRGKVNKKVAENLDAGKVNVKEWKRELKMRT